MASETAQTPDAFHGGRLIARRLKAHGVSRLFTLSGGHLFSIYDGCREEGIDLVDVRHESTAAFAAEGWAKVTREPGVCALTAGPGVTNGMSAMASAQANHSPMVVLGGRAPALRWGQGSLQEIDHVPFVRPLTKLAATPQSTAEIPGLVDDAFAAAAAPHGGPTFVDFPLDYVFMEAAEPAVIGAPAVTRRGRRRRGEIERAAELLRGAERPVIMAGTDLYWGHGGAGAAELARDAADPRVPQRPRARLRAGGSRAVLLARALAGAAGRGRGARDRRADGLPAGLWRRVRARTTEIVVIDAAEPSATASADASGRSATARICDDARRPAQRRPGQALDVERALDRRAARRPRPSVARPSGPS